MRILRHYPRPGIYLVSDSTKSVPPDSVFCTGFPATAPRFSHAARPNLDYTHTGPQQWEDRSAFAAMERPQ
ncbi:hypothetical protein SBA5_980008 [Candidatus Sulfotelmatomonas gaucii]|uniref:Uncharacterized protein n=1 Tax=Candidatus Sulfuritelmatomonas gaucii TaxID=2043161 RepID=A0A2N9MAG6_9BACT|nr:hypothetical protein SBA5_980008 [Candidatus Sulfotelmatomonas gaucii]